MRRLPVVALLVISACGDAISSDAATAAARIAPASAITQRGVVGTDAIESPAVHVTTERGDPVAGMRVTFRVTSGGGLVSPDIVTTDAQGLATTRWRLGTQVMMNAITASVGTLAPVRFSADAAAGPVARLLAKDGAEQVALPRATLPRALTVQVLDQYGNPIAGAEVTFSVVTGNGAVDRTVVTSDSLGLASSGRWTLGAEAGLQRVRATSGATWIDFRAGELLPARELVFTRQSDGRLVRIWADGTGAVEMPAPDFMSQRLSGSSWSPDGSRIAFARTVGGTGDIYIMSAEGSHLVQRTSGSGYFSVVWSPDGTKLAVSTEGLYESAVWIISTDDDHRAPVLLASDGRSPAWSPNGKTLVYVQVSGDDGYDELALVNSDGTGRRVITSGGGGRYGTAWSPDGKQIAGSTCKLAVCDIFIMDADGTHERRLTNVGTAQQVSWSPDGRWIATSLITFPFQSVIALLSVEDGIPHAIAGARGYGPAWRP